jgi:glucose/arabinose dehydrogenase
MKRYVDPSLVMVPNGYRIEVVKTNLNVPIALEILDNGEMYYGDSGITDGNGKLVKLTPIGSEVIASGFEPPLTGITYHNGEFYVSHRGSVTKVTMDGEKVDLLVGLPSYGDHHNNRVVFGPDGKMYFGQGTATNSGVVGLDNEWVKDHSYFHDFPAKPIRVTGKNFETTSFISSKETRHTGAFAPFGTQTYDDEEIKSILPGSGSILRANQDGSNLELVAWGLRNPFGLKFDSYNRLWTSNHGMDVRGSRPIKNSPDEFRQIQPDNWYGWPDFTGGYPVNQPFFKPDNGKQPELLMKHHPMIPPLPLVNFAPHSAIMGFDFNPFPSFGYVGDCFIAEFGAEDPLTTGGSMIPHVGHQVSKINMQTGQVTPFAQNRTRLSASESGGVGLERPIDVVFSNQSLYILDFGILNVGDKGTSAVNNTGMIWRVTRL